MSRLAVFFICSGVFAVSAIFTGDFSGVRVLQYDNEYLMQARASLPAVLVGILMIPFVFMYKPKGSPCILIEPVSIWSRIAAFSIDALMALSIISPVLALPALFAEWHETSVFTWAFTRHFPRDTDSLVAFVCIIPATVWIIIYLALPIAKNRQTLGQYIMGYRISDASGKQVSFKRAVLRNVYGFMVLSLWIITIPMGFSNSKKHMLHDSEHSLRPERLTYK